MVDYPCVLLRALIVTEPDPLCQAYHGILSLAASLSVRREESACEESPQCHLARRLPKETRSQVPFPWKGRGTLNALQSELHQKPHCPHCRAARPTNKATADTVLKNTTLLAHLGLVFKFIMKLCNTDIS